MMKINTPEIDLMSLVSLGDENAFEKVVNQYTGILLAKAYKLLKDEDGAKDIVQDIFLELWLRRETITITTELKAYLLGMLKHRFLRQVSRSNIHDKAMDHLSNRMQEMEDGIIEAIQLNDINRTLSEIVEQLPYNMQQIFILRDKDYSIKEIAVAMGLAEQTVKSYNSELKRRIKKGLLEKHPEISHSLLIISISKFI